MHCFTVVCRDVSWAGEGKMVGPLGQFGESFIKSPAHPNVSGVKGNVLLTAKLHSILAVVPPIEALKC